MTLLREYEGYMLADTAKLIGDFKLGEGTSVWFGAVVRADEAPITIGSRVNIQDNAVVHPQPGVPVEMGDDITVGHGAIIHCRKVGSNSLVGMGAILLDGAEIGENCIIGAGSLVSAGKKIPDGSLVYGVPGKVIRPLKDEEVKSVTESATEYMEMARRYVAGEIGA